MVPPSDRGRGPPPSVAELPELLEGDGSGLAFARVHVADPDLGLGPLLTNQDETGGYGYGSQQADDKGSDNASSRLV